MKQTILAMPLPAFRAKLRRGRLLCLGVGLTALALNLAALLFLTRENRTFLWLTSSAVDFLCISFLIFYRDRYLSTPRKLLRLYTGKALDLTGPVSAVSGETLRHMDLDCLQVTVGSRQLFLPVDTIPLEVGKNYRFRIVAGIITEAEA